MELAKYIEGIIPSRNEKKPKRINNPIQQLLDDFSNSKSGKVHESRRELQRRFEYQSFEDQKKIIRAFMKKAVKTDVVWCSKYFVMEYADTVYLEGEAVELVDYLFWENEYLDVVKSYWLPDMENYKLLKVLTRFESPEYLKEKIKTIENEMDGIIDSIAYSSLLLKVCEDKRYPLPKERLTPFKYAFISAKTNRKISEEDASAAIIWAAKHETSWPLHFVRDHNDQLVFHDYKYSTVGLALWSLSKLGQTSAIIRFNEWILSVIKILEAAEYMDFTTIDNTVQEYLDELNNPLYHALP